ncbi:unnamed protein product, partial [Dovyalis caffra]
VDWWIYDKDYTSKYIGVPIMGHPLGYNDKVFTHEKDGTLNQYHYSIRGICRGYIGSIITRVITLKSDAILSLDLFTYFGDPLDNE